MRRALLRLPVRPTHIKVDGDRLPRIVDLKIDCRVEAIVDGDARVAAISAASILAKTWRDGIMAQLDRCYPGFDLAVHKGYATTRHLDALSAREPSPVHRRSFSPIRWVEDSDDYCD
jgi:ribonuclease HII